MRETPHSPRNTCRTIKILSSKNVPTHSETLNFLFYARKFFFKARSTRPKVGTWEEQHYDVDLPVCPVTSGLEGVVTDPTDR